ncbi:TPA: type IV pilus major pilin, partial [Vibrio cholerae O1]
NLNLTNITHVEKLCTGTAPFTVAFGNS